MIDVLEEIADVIGMIAEETKDKAQMIQEACNSYSIPLPNKNTEISGKEDLARYILGQLDSSEKEIEN